MLFTKEDFMEDNTEEKLGKTVIDGRIVDLDNASVDELKMYLESTKNEERKLQRKIDEILGIDNER